MRTSNNNSNNINTNFILPATAKKDGAQQIQSVFAFEDLNGK